MNADVLDRALPFGWFLLTLTYKHLGFGHISAVVERGRTRGAS